ncbi:MAG: DUF3467 domain-containing protein [Chloroflexi bacterium]|nr:DUF3467 domain-containing protein [Chloroflexota bacterium]
MSEPSDPAKKKPKKRPLPKQVKLELPPDMVPLYANLVRIAHSPSELVFDFSRLLPGDKSASVLSRVLMSPLSAKLLQRALAENLAKYETVFGEISIPQKKSLADYLFKPNPNDPESPEEEK